MRAAFLTSLFGLLIIGIGAADDAASQSSETPAVALDPQVVRGLPDQDLVKVNNARYFVWHDSKGWHLRTAARALTQYSGSIKVTGGTFGKLRPIGLEQKARNPDRWGVSEDRTELRFEIHTVGSFDGFDFEIRRTSDDATVAFDLKQGRTQKSMPARIYLGKNDNHPKSSHFACAAAPDLVKSEVPEPD